MTHTHVPLYVQIKDYIIDKINNESYEVGAKIPSEKDLKKQFNVSSTTVVRALNDLVSEGYIERRQGEGSFVLSPKLQRNFLNLGITEEFRKQGIELKTNVIKIQEVIEPKISKKLKLDLNSSFLEIIRQRYVVINGQIEPIALQTSYLLNNIISVEELNLLKEENSLYDVLYTSRKVIPYKANEIVNIQLIKEKSIADLLDQEKGAPTLFVERITHDKNGSIFEYAESYFKWNRYSLEVELKLDSQKNN